MKRPKITVVGSANVDLITYIDRMPKEGETITAPSFAMGFGGKGANQSVAAALLGADVRMVCKVGDDLFGPNTKRNFESYGIDTRHVETVPGVSSGVAPIFVDPSSANRILIIKGANDHLRPSDIDRAKVTILSSDIVIMQLEVPLETVYYTLDLCARENITTILNPAPADPELDLERIRSASIFAPNETEVHTITGMPVGSVEEAKAAGRHLLAKGIGRVIVTLGERGSLLMSADREYLCPAVHVESRDSTGAGDAFIGCFATFFIETGDIESAMQRANRYAALSTMKLGTQKSFLDRKAFESAQL